MTRTHTIPDDAVHYKWDVANDPVLTVASGDTVVMTTRDVSNNQVTPSSDVSVITEMDRSLFYPLAGPIAVNGAEPGDTLAIEVVDLQTKGWGWAAIVPGAGLLPDDFPDPYLRVFDLTRGDVTYLREDIAIPVEPFLGTMGVCPAGATEQAVLNLSPPEPSKQTVRAVHPSTTPVVRRARLGGLIHKYNLAA